MGRDGFESTSMSRYLPTSANMSRQKFSGTMTLATSSAASSSWRLMDNPLAEPPGVSLAHLAPTHPRYPGGDRSEDRRRTEKSTPSTGAVDARAVMTEMTAKPVRQETLTARARTGVSPADGRAPRRGRPSPQGGRGCICAGPNVMSLRRSMLSMPRCSLMCHQSV
jgi:hypothetical protein